MGRVHFDTSCSQFNELELLTNTSTGDPHVTSSRELKDGPLLVADCTGPDQERTKALLYKLREVFYRGVTLAIDTVGLW